ncbi:MAG: M48 family metallopeptidase [Oscillospiraceae bacterium]|nr:M48 family metallopeptidase [Oscillospiraceae bacterium]
MTDYRVVRSKRKSLAIEVTRELEVIVRAPFFVTDAQIERFVEGHREWLKKAIERVRERRENYTPLSDEQIATLKKAAKDYIPAKVMEYSALMGLKPSGIKITSARTRFGSCSGKNSLCFSYLLMQKPLEAVDYVIVHELAHIKHKDHGKRFYALIEKYMPDYRERNKLLKHN